MNPYALLAAPGREHQRFLDELRQWHDQMVMHQRSVRRLGPRVACSDECPHAQGRRLWGEARALFGTAADSLTFLRTCAAAPARPAPGSASRR